MEADDVLVLPLGLDHGHGTEAGEEHVVGAPVPRASVGHSAIARFLPFVRAHALAWVRLCESASQPAVRS